MNTQERYNKLEESYREWANQIKNPNILFGKLEQFGYWGLKCLGNKVEEAFQHSNTLYQATLKQAKKIKMNVSTYPKTLEAIPA